MGGVGLLVGAAAGVALPRAFPGVVAQLRRGARSAPPLRWALPTPDALDVTSSEGVARLAPPLHAPFSGEPCVAWRVKLFFDVPGDAVPEQCVLDEGRAGALTVGEHRYTADTLVLDDDGGGVEIPLEFSALDDYLRARGFDGAEGQFRVVEWKLPLDAEVVVDEGVIRAAATRVPAPATPAAVAAGS